MQLSDLPKRFPIPFANNAGAGYIREIPTPHQAATGSDAPASLYDGFPPECFTPETSGGIPPNGKDFNGLLFQLSAWARWQAAGGAEVFNSDFCTAIGGYPKGTKLMSTSNPALTWISTADNNTTDPDGGSPADWTAVAAAVLSGNGYLMLPGCGFILQWGNGTQSGSSGAQAVTFPIAFPNACFWSHASNVASGPPAAFHGTGGETTTGITVYSASAANVAAPAGVAFFWIAIGY